MFNTYALHKNETHLTTSTLSRLVTLLLPWEEKIRACGPFAALPKNKVFFSSATFAHHRDTHLFGLSFPDQTTWLCLNREKDLALPQTQNTLAQIFAHEMHHAMRWAKTSAQNTTLGDRLVCEGLAQVFEREITGTTTSTARTLEFTDLAPSSAYFKSHLRDKARHHDATFIQTNPQSPPPVGYSFSFYLVDSWLTHNQQTSSQCVNVGSDKIILPWLANAFPLQNNAPSSPTIARIGASKSLSHTFIKNRGPHP